MRLRLIKIAARVIETASRVRLAFAAGCPEADLFGGLPVPAPLDPERRGRAPPPLVIPPTRSQKLLSGGEKAERTRAPRGPKSRVGTKSKIVVNRKG